MLNARRLSCSTMLLLCMLACLPARTARTQVRSTISAAVGPEVAFSPTDVYAGGGYDYISGSEFQLAVGFQAEAYYRFAFPWFALGLEGGATWPPRNFNPCIATECSEHDHLYTLWHTALDAKLYPLAGEKVELWFAVGAGIVGASFYNGTQVAPTLGGGLGVDVIFEKYVTLGFEVRMRFHMFGNENSHIDTINNSFWASLTFFKLGFRIPVK